MKGRFLRQPAEADRLGDFLKEQLGEAAGWIEFRAAVAFVKRSGVMLVADELAAFSRRGRVRISVGVDVLGTSREGLEILLEKVVGSGGEVYVFHNEHAMRPTFHPKVYLFKKPGAALLTVGSGNLTLGGLFTNYEGGLIVEIDQNDRNDVELLTQVETMLETWCDTASGLAHPLDAHLLAALVEERLVPTEEQARGDEVAERDRKREEEQSIRRRLFRRIRVPAPPRARRLRTTPGQPTGLLPGRLVWTKTLPASDAQSVATGTNPVGGVRLAQARFRGTDGEYIDPTTYFRRDLFGNFEWVVKRPRPLVEEAKVPFEVTILGKKYGVVELAISDKPSGEAGQHNYTSMLHWGPLMTAVRERDLTGRTLNIYSAPEGNEGFFFLEVV